jgi:hypothetical protein
MRCLVALTVRMGIGLYRSQRDGIHRCTTKFCLPIRIDCSRFTERAETLGSEIVERDEDNGDRNACMPRKDAQLDFRQSLDRPAGTFRLGGSDIGVAYAWCNRGN